MRAFKFNEPNYGELGLGKISTVRKGIKSDVSIGQKLLLENEQTGEKLEVTTRKIEFMMVMDLTRNHAMNDGFDGLESLICELEECYGERLNAGDTVTVITFNHLGKDLL